MFVSRTFFLSPSAFMLLCVSSLASGFSGLALAQTSVQVLDINKTPLPNLSMPTPGGSGSNHYRDRNRFVLLNSQIIYPAKGLQTGTELYSSLGAPHSGKLILDIQKGIQGSEPDQLTLAGKQVFFSADNGVHGRELWVTDGTPKGTRMVVDLWPGAGHGLPMEICALGKTGKIVFQAQTWRTGLELFISDGTAKGTKLLKDINAWGSQSSYPSYMRSFHDGKRDLVLFNAYEPFLGFEPWVTDGTAAGTTLLKDIAKGLGSSRPKEFQVLGKKAIFTAYTESNGRELWISDGTSAGTRLVKDVAPGFYSGTSLYHGLALNGRFYFEGTTLQQGSELWVTDGTPKGTMLVSDSMPGMASGGFQYGTILGSQIIYAGAGQVSSTVPWILDTVTGKTRALKQIGLSSPDFATMGKSVFFSAQDGNYGNELFISDGTAAGTKLLKDITLGTGSSFCRNLTPLPNKRVLFTTAEKRSLWVTDGTSLGTLMIPVITSNTPTASSDPESVEVFNDRLYFGANDGKSGHELWVSDGTIKGTRLVKDLYPGNAFGGQPNSSRPMDLTRFGTQFLFSARGGANKGRELWTSDGTAAGSRMLKDIFDGQSSSNPGHFARIGSKLYFAATGYDNARPRNYVGHELYVTDGTAAGTVLLADLDPGGGSSSPTGFTEIGHSGRFVFAANNSSTGSSRRPTGRELWVSDGTAAGTKLLLDLIPGPASGSPGDFEAMGGKVYFSATSPLAGRELWVTDGTSAGTRMVKDLLSGSKSSSPLYLTAQGGKLYFQAWIPGVQRELFVSDGTATGTRLFKDLLPSYGDSEPASITAVGSRHLWFEATTLSQNAYWRSWLWKSDLTVAGTRVYAALDPKSNKAYVRGFQKSGKQRFVAWRGKVFFAGMTPKTGKELWFADNGATATRRGQACRSSYVQSTDPVLGSKVTISGSTRAGFRANVLLLGTGIAKATPLGGGCQLYLNLAGPLVLLSSNTGRTYSTNLGIPNTAALLGARARLQSFHLGTRFPATSGFSNGLDWTLGK